MTAHTTSNDTLFGNVPSAAYRLEFATEHIDRQATADVLTDLSLLVAFAADNAWRLSFDAPLDDDGEMSSRRFVTITTWEPADESDALFEEYCQREPRQIFCFITNYTKREERALEVYNDHQAQMEATLPTAELWDRLYANEDDVL